jgi:hypothetical protein
MFRGKIYVPNDRDLRRRIVEQHHDICITGHTGCFKTLKMVSQNYWWPQMSQYIGIYIKTCDLCNQTKLQHHWPFGELHPPETPEKWWDIISVNFIVELPDSYGYNVTMNIVDSVSKQVHCILTHTTINAEGATLLFFREVWKHHGLPRAVLSDQGPQFITEFTHELHCILGI